MLAAVLDRRWAREVFATDVKPRAAQSARDHVSRLGLADGVAVAQAELWP